MRLRDINFLAVAMMILLTAGSAMAQTTLLFDTGQPTGTSAPLLCGSTCGAGAQFQYVAGQFTPSDSYSISSAQLWVQVPSTGGQLAVAIRSDNGGLPGASVFSQSYTMPNQTTSGWVTFTFAQQPVLDANNTYWLSFEPVANSSISYNVPGGAPNPLTQYAVYNSLNSGWFTEATSQGMRLSGSPAQGATTLIDTGAGTNSSTSWSLFNSGGQNFNFLAGQFVLGQAASLQSVEGWMDIFTGGNVNVKIYSGNQQGLVNNTVPGVNIFSQTFTEPGTGLQQNWIPFQFSEPYPVLAAGTYWLSFEPAVGNFNAGMASGAPNPLPTYAYYTGLEPNWLNQLYNGTPFDIGMRALGTTLPSLAFGTAARVTMTGTVFGLPFTPQDAILGGDGIANTAPWNFVIPAGWSYARGRLTPNQLDAGAYADTSGPCNSTPGTCGNGAGRGVAYRTWTNTSNSSLTFQINSQLTGEFQQGGGTVTAGVYVFDTTAFTNTVTASGLATPQFLLNNSTITALAAGGQSLALSNLFPQPAVLLSDFRTVTGPLNQLLTIPLTSEFITIAPNQSITVMYDVSAYAPPLGDANFANTLEPSSTLPFFADQNGNAVTQLVAVGPSVPAPVTPTSITLSPATSSEPEGTTATVTATVMDSSGNPIPNVPVFFAFNSGPNVGPTGPISTDSNGQAAFTYTDNGGSGTDVIQATIGSVTATPVSVSWTVPGPLDHITIAPATASIASGGTQSYTATGFDRFNNSIGDVTSQTTFTITPNGLCTGATCTATVSGVHMVTATNNGKTAQASLTVNAQTTPTITWSTPAPIIYGMPLGATQLNATASVPGTFAYNPAAGAVLLAGIQTLSVLFTPTDTTHYTTASAHVNLQINKATATITWPTPAPITAGTPLSATQLDATANVSGTFAYNPGVGTVLNAGSQTLSVTFTPNDAGDYNSASAKVTLVVNPSGKTTPTITWPTPTPITFGMPLTSQQLDAKANVPGAFVYTPSAGTILKAGTQTLTVMFTPSNTSAYGTATAKVTLQVNQAKPPVLWIPIPIVYRTPLGPLQLDALTLVPGKFVYNPPAGTVLAVGPHTLSAVFTPKDTTDFQTITVTAVLEVLKNNK